MDPSDLLMKDVGVECRYVEKVKKYFFIPFHCRPCTLNTRNHDVCLVNKAHIDVIIQDWLWLPQMHLLTFVVDALCQVHEWVMDCREQVDLTVVVPGDGNR